MVWHTGQADGQDLRDRVLNAKGSIREMATRFIVVIPIPGLAEPRDVPGV